MSDRFEFTLNGKVHTVEGQPANRPLLDYLRAAGLTGSKQGCAEGDCGACTVAIVETGAGGERTLRAVNSCITLLPMVAGRELVTVEGLASPAQYTPSRLGLRRRRTGGRAGLRWPDAFRPAVVPSPAPGP